MPKKSKPLTPHKPASAKPNGAAKAFTVSSASASPIAGSSEPPKKKLKEDTKLQFATSDAEIIDADSVPSTPMPKTAAEVLAWMIHPVTVAEFMEKYWEKKPFVVKRNNPEYYGKLFKKADLDNELQKTELFFAKDMNLAKVVDGKKRMMCTPGDVADYETVQKAYRKGATLQVYQPQRWSDNLYQLMYCMEEYFGCLVGANSYMTPAGTQGLAPHFDDVEVFVMQVEGAKHWHLYQPPISLPREYSRDFDVDKVGDPILEVTIEEGDFMYFPRGYVHYAHAVSTVSSHHITVSTYQQFSMYELVLSTLPAALAQAFKADEKFRQGVPVGFHKYTGKVHEAEPKAIEFADRCKKLLQDSLQYVDVHQTADEFLLDFNTSRLPPPEHAIKKFKKSSSAPQLTMLSQLRLINPEWVRVTITKPVDWFAEFHVEGSNDDADDIRDGYILISHCLNNSRTEHMLSAEKKETQGLRFPLDFQPAIRKLFERYPNSLKVANFPIEDEEERLIFAQALVEEGVAIVAE